MATAAKQLMMARMTLDPAQAPDDIATLKALLAASQDRVQNAEQRADKAEARALDLDGLVAHLKLTIAKMCRWQWETDPGLECTPWGGQVRV